MSGLSAADVPGVLAGANLLSRPAEEFENDAAVEALWAQKAFEHAEIYFNLLCSADPRLLRLTPNDDEIYLLFRRSFPSMKIDVIDENEMMSPMGKQKWRAFSEQLQGKVEDYSFGTLLRIDSTGVYSEKNSILSPRSQFLAVEIARNREGYNDGLRKAYRPPPAETST